MEEQGPWQDYAQPERPPWEDYHSGGEQPQQVPEAFIERIRRGQELQDAVTQSGDSFDKRFNEAYGDPFEAAAARTRQSVAPGRRQESLVTRLPEMMTAALVHGVTIGPILAAKRLGEKTMAGEDILDSESIADATAVAGLGMFAGTHFSRVGPAGVQRIGELPKAEDFRTGADVMRSPAAEQNLRDLWEERGIHPAEAVHDAGNDAFLKADLTHPNPEPRDRSGIARVTGSPVAEGTPRTELAKTGEAHIDAVLDSELTNRNIDNPVINDSYDVPYSAGGSTPLDDPTVYIDRHFPRSMTIDGVTFDPADPFTVHENLEQHVMDLLTRDNVYHGTGRTFEAFDTSYSSHQTGAVFFSDSVADATKFSAGKNVIAARLNIENPLRVDAKGKLFNTDEMNDALRSAKEAGHDGLIVSNIKNFAGSRPTTTYAVFDVAKIERGMDSGTAYKVAHHEWAEKAEGAWYRAHGIDQAKAEEAYRPFIDQIEHEKLTSAKPETIASAAIRAKDEIFEGIQHFDARERAEAKYGQDVFGESGFVTTRGRFVDAKEAAKIANENQQLTEEGLQRAARLNKKDILLSEDLKKSYDLPAGTPPPNLYEKPYPHQDVRSAKNETGPVPKPTAEEIARAKEIVARAMESGELRPAIGGAEQVMARAQRRVAADTRQAFQASTLPAHNADLESFKSEFPNARPLGVADTFEIPMKDGAGAIEVAHNFGVIKIRSAYVEPEFEGKGYGVQAYKDVVDWAMARRLRVQSSSSVKVGAVRVYEALARRGYDVERNPNASVSPAGNVRTSDATPAFEISSQFRGPAGADITRPESLPTLDEQPPPRPGTLVTRLRQSGDDLVGLGHNLMFTIDPMAAGTKRAMVPAKDFANTIRRVDWEWNRVDGWLKENFNTEARTRMFNAMDEESVALQLGESREHQGLATLEPTERAAVQSLDDYQQAAWVAARDLGMVEGDGIPMHATRFVLNIASSDGRAPLALDTIGRNLTVKTGNMLRRKYMTVEETETAAKAKFGEEAVVARDIRAVALSTAKLEKAIAGRTLINNIKEIGQAAGQELVTEGEQPGYFTLNHPALRTWRPRIRDGAAVVDESGNTIFDPVQLHIANEFEGPLRSILDEPTVKDPRAISAQNAYGALMTLKGKAMTVILNSPIIHNAVVWGKVAPSAPGQWAGFRLYFTGNRIANDPVRSAQLVERGLAPIGHRGSFQDISGVMEEPSLRPGRSWTAEVLRLVPDLFDEARPGETVGGPGDKVAAAIDKAGDFVHNTLLWDRVRDVQFGLADHLSRNLVQGGLDQVAADRIGSHFSNMIVGSIPKEAMSLGARQIANMLMFSRSFTLGNLNVLKTAAVGLPKPLMAQLERDMGIPLEEAPEGVRSYISTLGQRRAMGRAARMALGIVAIDYAVSKVVNSLIQNGANVYVNDSTWHDETKGYAKRLQAEMDKVKTNPFELLNPMNLAGLPTRLTPMSENEPGKENRIHFGFDKEGTALYANNPMGKYPNELTDWFDDPWGTLMKKMAPLPSAIFQVMANDKGFRKPIRDLTAQTTTERAKNMLNVVEHILEKHTPEMQLRGLGDLLMGEGDRKTNMLRTFGPMAGFTVSQGAPGGMGKGEILAERASYQAKFDLAWPEIRKQIKRGDEEGAREAMTALGIPPVKGRINQRSLIRAATNPAFISGQSTREFLQRATPEAQERFLNAR